MIEDQLRNKSQWREAPPYSDLRADPWTASLVRHPSVGRTARCRTGRPDGGNGKCGGSAPQAWKPYLSLGSAATAPPAGRSVRFDRGRDRRGGRAGDADGAGPDEPRDRAAFVAQWRIPEGGVAGWVERRAAFGLPEPQARKDRIGRSVCPTRSSPGRAAHEVNADHDPSRASWLEETGREALDQESGDRRVRVEGQFG